MGATHAAAYENHLRWMMHMGTIQLASHLGVRELMGVKLNYPEDHVYEFSFFTMGRLYTAKAREVICTEAVKAGADYVLMLDDDMIVPIDWFEKLIRHEVDICAAFAVTRNKPFWPVIYQKEEGIDKASGRPFAYNRNLRNYPRNKLVECDAVGFGGVLIKVDILKKLSAPYFCLTSPNGEDINFCYRAKEEVGARIFMDTSVKLGHLGAPFVATEEVADAYVAEHGTEEDSTKNYVDKYKHLVDMKS